MRKMRNCAICGKLVEMHHSQIYCHNCTVEGIRNSYLKSPNSKLRLGKWSKNKYTEACKNSEERNG